MRRPRSRPPVDSQGRRRVWGRLRISIQWRCAIVQFGVAICLRRPESRLMELTDYLSVVRKYWVSVVTFALGGLAVAAVSSLVSTPTYTATTSVFLTVQSGSSAGELNQGSTYAENQVRSYAEVVRTPIVLQPVIDRLMLDMGPADLAEHVSASVPMNTAIVEISVVEGDPTRTAEIANEIGRQVVTIVDELSPSGAGGSKSVQATVITPASVPTEWTTPKVAQNLLLGSLLALVLGVGQAILRSTLDTRVLTESDIARVAEGSVIGVVGYDIDAAEHPLIFQADPHSPRAEAYRRLRTNLQFLEFGGRNRSIVITSSLEGEGKTTTAINVASTLAESGQSVLLVDADLRRPRVAEYLNLEGAAGLTTVIIGQADLMDVVQPFGNGNLHVLTSGQIPPNPSELLGSEAMKRILGEATDRYDMVVLDAPPLLPVTDSAILSAVTGGALVVVGSGTVRAPQLAGALDSIGAVGGEVLGLVLNKLRIEDAGQYGYHQYYYHRDGHKPTMAVDHSVKRSGPRAAPVEPSQMIEPRA